MSVHGYGITHTFNTESEVTIKNKHKFISVLNQCLSPLTLWVRIRLRWGVLDTTLCDKVCQWLAAGQWFSLDIPVSSTNNTDRHDIAEILLKVALNTITLNLNLHLGGCFVDIGGVVDHHYFNFLFMIYLDNTLQLLLITTYYWFQDDQSLLLFLNTEYIAEKQQIPVLMSLVWPYQCLNPQYTALDVSTLTITHHCH